MYQYANGKVSQAGVASNLDWMYICRMLTLLVVEVYECAGALLLDDSQTGSLQPRQAYDRAVHIPAPQDCWCQCGLLRCHVSLVICRQNKCL